MAEAEAEEEEAGETGTIEGEGEIGDKARKYFPSSICYQIFIFSAALRYDTQVSRFQHYIKLC